MKRREFIALGIMATAGRYTFAAPLTEKDILREGQPATIANYCESPEKQPNKICPTWKDKKGFCDTCMFYNKDNSATTYKGKAYARCQLLADPKRPQFVAAKAYCSTFVAKT